MGVRAAIRRLHAGLSAAVDDRSPRSRERRAGASCPAGIARGRKVARRGRPRDCFLRLGGEARHGRPVTSAWSREARVAPRGAEPRYPEPGRGRGRPDDRRSAHDRNDQVHSTSQPRRVRICPPWTGRATLHRSPRTYRHDLRPLPRSNDGTAARSVAERMVSRQLPRHRPRRRQKSLLPRLRISSLHGSLRQIPPQLRGGMTKLGGSRKAASRRQLLLVRLVFLAGSLWRYSRSTRFGVSWS